MKHSHTIKQLTSIKVRHLLCFMTHWKVSMNTYMLLWKHNVLHSIIIIIIIIIVFKQGVKIVLLLLLREVSTPFHTKPSNFCNWSWQQQTNERHWARSWHADNNYKTGSGSNWATPFLLRQQEFSWKYRLCLKRTRRLLLILYVSIIGTIQTPLKKTRRVNSEPHKRQSECFCTEGPLARLNRHKKDLFPQ